MVFGKCYEVAFVLEPVLPQRIKVFLQFFEVVFEVRYVVLFHVRFCAQRLQQRPSVSEVLLPAFVMSFLFFYCNA